MHPTADNNNLRSDDLGFLEKDQHIHCEPKKKTPTLANISNNFNNNFTLAFGNKLRKKVLYNLPPHLSLLPHHVAKFECSTVQLNRIVIQFRNVQNHLFTVYIYKDVTFSITSMPINLQHYSTCSKTSAISTHVCFE